MRRVYLGVSHTFHDSAVAVVDSEGKLVYAQATERPTQNKRGLFMVPITERILKRALKGVMKPGDELVVAFTWKLDEPLRGAIDGWFVQPELKKVEPTLPASFFLGTRTLRTLSYLQVREFLPRIGLAAPMVAPEPRALDHHLTHAYTACYGSPYEEAVCAVIDGMGDDGSTAAYHYVKGELRRLDTPEGGLFPSGSLGFYYSALCDACGFDPHVGEEWKVMGLSAYGRFDQELYDLLRPFVEVDDLRVHSKLPPPEAGARWDGLRQRFAAEAKAKGPIAYADLAHTGQVVFEHASQQLLENLHRRGLSNNLILAGGCALNSLWNGRITQKTGFTSLYVPSAPADDGNAIGAAWMAFKQDHPDWRPTPATLSPYLGDEIDDLTVERAIEVGGLVPAPLNGKPVHRRAAELLAEGKILGWAQGRAEFGPRALGNRSILADARVADIKNILNAKVKFREEFRPFAPSVLHEYGAEYFENYQESAYMDRTLRLREEVRSKIPGAVHEDATGRLQSVKREWNPRYWDLIDAFREITGVPLIINTSFNVMGKPIIHSAEDALAVYFTTGLDALVINDRLFVK